MAVKQNNFNPTIALKKTQYGKIIYETITILVSPTEFRRLNIATIMW